MAESKSTDLLLGQIIADVRALNDRLDRNDRHAREQRDSDRAEIKDLKSDVDELKTYMLRVEGGKRMLFGMLAISATLGGLIWNVLSHYLPFK